MDANATVIGIDLGGTKIDAARYNSSWEIEESLRMDTEASQGFEHVFEELLSAVAALKNDTTAAIGIGVPGLVLHPEGKILQLPNIPGAENILLQKMLTEKTGLTCIVDNDANCFALAEVLHGAGKGHSVAVGITMGTGVGGGIVLHGQLLQGSQGFAGEFGHMLLMPGNPPFETSDKRGDIEQFLSGTAMGKRCTEAKSPEEYLDGKVCSFMQPDIYREVAWMCTNIIHMLDPSVIIFGGSAGKAVTAHLKEITTELEAWILPGTPLPLLKPAELKDAATLGAALLTNQATQASGA
jgi:glucokinase